MELVAILPPILLVKVLPDNDNVFDAFKLVIVAFVAFKLLVLVVDAVIFVANKLVKNPEIEFKIFAKKLSDVVVPFR